MERASESVALLLRWQWMMSFAEEIRLRHDFPGFLTGEMANRENVFLPPPVSAYVPLQQRF